MSRLATEPSIRPVPQRWAMPVSLEPRAARQCVIVHAVTKRPVARSPLGFHVRPNRCFQVMVVPPAGDVVPASVRLIASRSVKREPVSTQTSRDGCIVYWLDFEPRREDGWPWYFRGLLSQMESICLHLEYSDGRDDYEQHLPLVVTPSRAWVLWSLILTVFFYFLSQLTERLLATAENPSVFGDYLLHLIHNPLPWVLLAGVIAGLWIVVSILDRLCLALHWRRWRHEFSATS